MFLTISTTGTPERPATDLGYLLHKHPEKAQAFSTSYGRAHVLYPEADDQRCTAVQHGEYGTLGARHEAEPRQGVLAEGATGQLPRFVLVGLQFPRLVPHQAVSLSLRVSNSTFSRISSTNSGMPSLVLQLVKTKGFLPRIMRESSSITCKLAPT